MRYLIAPLCAVWLLICVVPAMADSGPAACTEQIVNGGFEEGRTGWSAVSAGGYDMFNQAAPYTGQWGAFLAGYDSADDRLAQDVALPAGQTATLSFWWRVRTDETDHPWDTLDVEVAPAGSASTRLLRVTDADAAAGWQQATFDLSAQAGQTITLAFHAQTDLDRPTDFYLDDISIAACPAAPAIYLYLPLALH